jgi:hypothetical protein
MNAFALLCVLLNFLFPLLYAAFFFFFWLLLTAKAAGDVVHSMKTCLTHWGIFIAATKLAYHSHSRTDTHTHREKKKKHSATQCLRADLDVANQSATKALSFFCFGGICFLHQRSVMSVPGILCLLVNRTVRSLRLYDGAAASVAICSMGVLCEVRFRAPRLPCYLAPALHTYTQLTVLIEGLSQLRVPPARMTASVLKGFLTRLCERGAL